MIFLILILNFISIGYSQKEYVRPKFTNVVNVCPQKMNGCDYWNENGDILGLVRAIKSTLTPATEFHVYAGSGAFYQGADITEMVNIVGFCGFAPGAATNETRVRGVSKKKRGASKKGTKTKSTNGTPYCKPYILPYQSSGVSNSGTVYTHFHLYTNANQDASGSCFRNLVLLGNSPVNAMYYGILADAVNTFTINRILIVNVEFYSQFIGVGILSNGDYWEIQDSTFDIWLNGNDGGTVTGGFPSAIYQVQAVNGHFGGNSITNNVIVLNVDTVNPPSVTNSFGIFISTINSPSNTITGNYIQCIGCSALADTAAEEGLYFAGWTSLIQSNTFDSFTKGLHFPFSANLNYVEYNTFLANYNNGIYIESASANSVPSNVISNNNITRTGYFGSGGGTPAGIYMEQFTATTLDLNDFENVTPDIVNDSVGTAFGINQYNVCSGSVGC